MITVRENYSDSNSHTYNVNLKVSIPKFTQERRYYAKQKALGVILSIVAIVASILDNNYIFSLFLIPVGIALITTKDKVTG